MVIVVPYALEQLEERVRIIDGVINLGYGKHTAYSLRKFRPKSHELAAQSKLTKSIKVIGRADRPDFANKCVKTDFEAKAG